MEKSFIISYDLPSGSDKYNALIDRIKQYGTWAHITLSTWAIVSECSANEIRDTLKSIIGEESRLIVVQSANVAAWSNSICSNDWLKKNI